MEKKNRRRLLTDMAGEDTCTHEEMTIALFNRNLARAIKNRRFHMGLSQKDLAEMAHVSRSTISSFERHNRGISMGVLIKLADALDVDIVLEPRKQDEMEEKK